jgi:uncharacterized protein YceK
MKKFLLASSAVALIALSGCQQVQTQVSSLSQQGQQTYNGLSQQANDLKNQALQTKAQFDQKSQQAVNAINDINKLTH